MKTIHVYFGNSKTPRKTFAGVGLKFAPDLQIRCFAIQLPSEGKTWLIPMDRVELLEIVDDTPNLVVS